MTRGNLLIVLVLTLAVVGMFIWMLDLNERQADLLKARAPSPDEPTGDREARLDRMERRLGEVETVAGANKADFTRLERQFRELEPARAPEGDLAALTDSEAPPGEASLRTAVEKILAQREAKDRKERYERMATYMSSRLLTEIDATQDQTQRFVKAIVTYLDERDSVRRKHRGPDADAQARDAELEQVTESRNAKLLEILGAADYAKIEERLNRGRQGFGGRRGGGPDRGRGPGGR